MKYVLMAVMALIFASCNQKNANPEQLDDIYKDLVVELGIISKSLDEEEKHLITLKQERSAAIPQTGQIKFSNKKVSDSEEKINLLKQQKQYFEIKIEQRINQAKIRHEESLRPGGKPWPDKEEVALYSSVVKFQRDKIAWEKTKGIKKLVPRGTEKK